MIPTLEVNPSSTARFATGDCVLRMTNAAADNRIDVYVELGVFGKQLQFLVEHFQTFLRHLVRHDVVDGNLHVLQTRAIQPLDTLGSEQVAIRDHPGYGAALTDVPNQIVQFGMQQRFAAAERDDAGAKIAQQIDAAQHLAGGYGLRKVVRIRCNRCRKGCTFSSERYAPEPDGRSTEGH